MDPADINVGDVFINSKNVEIEVTEVRKNSVLIKSKVWKTSHEYFKSTVCVAIINNAWKIKISTVYPIF